MSHPPANKILTKDEMLELAAEQRNTRIYDKSADSSAKIAALAGGLANELYNLPERISLNDTATVKIIAAQYTDACAQAAVVPNKVGLCRGFGVSRQAVDNFMSRNPTHPTTEFLEIVFDSFAQILADAALANSVNMVFSIFVAKAVYKWRDNIPVEPPTQDALDGHRSAEEIAEAYGHLED